MSSAADYHVLVLPATQRDGVVACGLLQRAGIDCVAMADAGEAAQVVGATVGALVIADTALARPGFQAVLRELSAQPPWSDLPVVLMSRSDELGAAASAAAVGQLTNVTVIDRPSSMRTLVSVVNAALRARRRQYQIRDQLVALQEAEEELRLADRQKDEFLATLAHELRNPLAPLRSAVQLMESGSVSPEQHERLLAMMARQTTTMVRLIEDLLDVARISSGKVTLQRQRLDLRPLLESVVEAAAVEAAGHRLRLSLPAEPAFVMGDSTRLEQVFGNLLNNAIKYTQHGGSIEIGLALQAEAVVVAVRDDGAGIPPVVLGRVFDMFAQVDRTLDRAQGGLGIGLALVRKLLDLHGGTVEASSEGADRGSTFTVRLPRLAGVAEPTRGPAGRGWQSQPARRLRILVVDDNRDAADTLALLLDTQGHEVRTAYDGATALKSVQDGQPHVVFCDIGMPGMNGHEVAAALRRGPHAMTALVAVTGWGAEDDRRLAREAGFDFHLTKPVDFAAITAILERL